MRNRPEDDPTFDCDPNDSLFEPTIAWIGWLIKIYQDNEELDIIEL